MNIKEKQMLEILSELHASHSVFSVKAEFEAEGTRNDDLLRLFDLVRRSGLSLTIKIGGCEAIRDLIECKQLGVDRIVAPMIETDYSLSKFIGAIKSVYSEDEISSTDFYINLETISAFENLSKITDEMVNSPVSGYVFGRVDFCGSLGFTREEINSDNVLNYANTVADNCIKNDLEFVVGGGVSNDYADFLKKLNEKKLNAFETRKIIFNNSILDSDLRKAIQLAVKFELLYLQNKHDYYKQIAEEDLSRIKMLETRVDL